MLFNVLVITFSLTRRSEFKIIVSIIVVSWSVNRIICVYKTLVGFLVVIGQKRYQRNVSELFTEEVRITRIRCLVLWY